MKTCVRFVVSSSLKIKVDTEKNTWKWL